MSGILLLFFVVLIILAAVFRADFVLVVLYFIAGAYVVSHWWSRKALAAIHLIRHYPRNAFIGEIVPVKTELKNAGFLPVVWVHVREATPIELAVEGNTQIVLYLGPKAKFELSYFLDCRKRGFYKIGPMDLFSGDLFGFSKQVQRTISEGQFTVFPKIIPLVKPDIPSHSPLGTLRHHLPIYEDPTRVGGKRPYFPGDTYRQIDWKATAITQQLQVKIFEPSIALEAMIFLNLNRDEFPIKHWSDASELSIVVAASLANWLVRARQSVGLATNGIDPLSADRNPTKIPVRSGQAQLMKILETLARVQCDTGTPLIQLFVNEYIHLTWGTSLIIITNQVSDEFIDSLFQAKKKGLSAMLILVGMINKFVETQEKARHFGFPIYHIEKEKDLDIWR